MKEQDLFLEIKERLDKILEAALEKNELTERQKEYLKSSEAAELMRISVGHFVNVVSKKSGFPKPKKISGTEKHGMRLWNRNELINWINRDE